MIETQLDRIESHLVEQEEMKALGHRIIYDRETGWSINIGGAWVDPKCLDANGFQIRFMDKDAHF